MPLALGQLVESLDGNQVEYVIIGGVAAIAHGSVTLTFDLDVCYAHDDANLERIVRALASHKSAI